MNRNYELMLVFASNVAEEKRNTLIEKFSKMASPKTVVEKWGMKKFAYPINYRNEGFYVLMHFACAPDNIKKMQDLFVITDGVVRFMFVAKDEKMLEADKARKAAKRERAAKAEGGEEAPKPEKPEQPKDQKAKQETKTESKTEKKPENKKENKGESK